jgi:heme/copper-type cytochrome/quinol oxidase subunit 2
MLYQSIVLYRAENKETLRVAFAHHTNLEIIWTLVPTAILISIAGPSFALLYQMDALAEPEITIKVIGHQ